MKQHSRALLLLAAATLLWAGCTVGPDYKRPDVPMTGGYKGSTSQPAAVDLQQDWWRLYNDPTLNDLEEQALAANFNLRAAIARVEEARASAGITKAGFFPTASFNPSYSRNYNATSSTTSGRTTTSGGTGTGTGSTTGGTGTGGTTTGGGTTGGGTTGGTTTGTTITGGSGGSRTSNSIILPFDISYEVDLWGRIRRAFEAAKARTQSAINDFGLVRLTLTTDLATMYFNVRSLDAQYEIAERNIQAYAKQVEYLETQQKAGFAAPLDVVQVRTLLESTRATQWDTKRQREVAVHSIAILLGKAPSEVDIPVNPLEESLPPIPVGLPADLLRTRPDVAEAEQNLVAANAEIGVAIAEFLPTLTLSATGGYRNSQLSNTINPSNRFGSIGPQLSIPLFDASLIPNKHLAQAEYAELLATYRSTILGAFRDVEDALTDMDLQARQSEAQAKAVADAREYLRLTEIQRKQGLITPLQVLDADRTVLTNELSAAQILNARMASSILLIKALGGGWNPALPPSTQPTTAPTTQKLSE